jgi:hypothetical protein
MFVNVGWNVHVLTLNQVAISIYVAMQLGGVYDFLGDPQERWRLDIMP